jgi:hypothetical protein
VKTDRFRVGRGDLHRGSAELRRLRPRGHS